MLTDEKQQDIERRLPVTDPDYITFKKNKGLLGDIDTTKVREEITEEIIARYNQNS